MLFLFYSSSSVWAEITTGSSVFESSAWSKHDLPPDGETFHWLHTQANWVYKHNVSVVIDRVVMYYMIVEFNKYNWVLI